MNIPALLERQFEQLAIHTAADSDRVEAACPSASSRSESPSVGQCQSTAATGSFGPPPRPPFFDSAAAGCLRLRATNVQSNNIALLIWSSTERGAASFGGSSPAPWLPFAIIEIDGPQRFSFKRKRVCLGLFPILWPHVNRGLGYQAVRQSRPTCSLILPQI